MLDRTANRRKEKRRRHMTYKYLKHNKLESIIHRHAEDGMQTQVGSVHADQSM